MSGLEAHSQSPSRKGWLIYFKRINHLLQSIWMASRANHSQISSWRQLYPWSLGKACLLRRRNRCSLWKTRVLAEITSQVFRSQILKDSQIFWPFLVKKLTPVLLKPHPAVSQDQMAPRTLLLGCWNRQKSRRHRHDMPSYANSALWLSASLGTGVNVLTKCKSQ